MSVTEPVSLSAIAALLPAPAENAPPLVLRGDTLGAAVPIGSLLMLLRVEQIELAHFAFTQDSDRLMLTGTTAVLGLADLAVTLTLRLTEDGLALALRASPGGGQQLALPGLPTLAIGGLAVALDVAVTATGRSVAGAISGTVTLGSVAVPVSIKLPMAASGWIVSGSFPEAQRPGIAVLSQVVSGIDLLPALPASFGEALKLSAFELVLQRAPYAAFTIVAAPLDIIPGTLSIADIELQVTVTLPTATMPSELRLRLQAMLDLGALLLPIVLERAEGGLGWYLDLDTSLVPLPGIADLAGLLGGTDSLNTLFPGLSGFGGLGLRSLRIELPSNFAGITALSFSGGTTAPWTLPMLPDLSLQEAVVALHIQQPLSAARAVTGSVRGSVLVCGLPFSLGGEKSSPSEPWRLVGRQLEEEPLSLLAIGAGLIGSELPAGIPDFAFVDLEAELTPATGEFALSGRSATPWRLPIGPTDLVVSDVAIALQRQLVSGVKRTTTQVSGKIAIAGVTAELAVSLPGKLSLSAQLPGVKLSDLVTSLCGENLLSGLGLPAELADLALGPSTLTLDPVAGRASLGGSIPRFGDFELVVRKSSGQWGFAMGIRLPASFSLGGVLHVPELDSLRFSDMVLVLATASDPGFKFQSAGSFEGVTRGLTLIATLSLAELGLVEALRLSISQVAVRMTIGTSPADLKLAAALNMSVDLGHGMVLRDPTLQLQVVPTVVGLTGTLDANIDSSALTFQSGFLVRSAPPSAELRAKMIGDWKDPFGAQGLTLSDLSLDWMLPLGLPGMGGTVRLGGNQVSFAIRFDVADPMLVAYLRFLDLGAMVNDLVTSTGGVPSSLTKTLTDIRMEDINLAVAPKQMTVGGVDYEPGITLSVARLSCWGVVGSGLIRTSRAAGMTLRGVVNEFALGDHLRMDGCQLDLALAPSTPPVLRLSGRATMLGITSNVLVALSDSGFSFQIQGRIFNDLSATLQVSGSKFPSGRDIQVQAQVDLAWLNQFQGSAVSAVDGWAGQADAALTSAQQLVAQKQRDNSAYAAKIESLRAQLIAERQTAQDTLAAAQRNVESAQAKVSALQGEISAMLATIAAERERDQRKLREAEAALAFPQAEVNRLNDEISATDRWFYGLPKTDWPWKPSRAREGTWFGIKMGGLYSAREVATGVLSAAARTVGLARQAIAAFPPELDPRVVALTTAKATAQAALDGYLQTLATARSAIKLYPIEADPALLALTTARETAGLGLVAAQEALAALESSLGPIATFASTVAGGALSIREASFSASLAGMVSSGVQMSVTLANGNRYTIDVDLMHAAAAAISLAKQVLGLDAPSAISTAQSRVQVASQADQLALASFYPEGGAVSLGNVASGKYVAVTSDNSPITFVANPNASSASCFYVHRHSDSSGTWMSFQTRGSTYLTLCVDGDLELRARAISNSDANNPAIWFQLRGDALFSKSAGRALNFVPAQSPLPVAFVACNGWYVSAAYGGGVDIISNKYVLTSWETFRLIQFTNGIALQVANGQYVSAEGGGGGRVYANKPGIGPYECFSLIDLGGGRVAFKAMNGNYLCAEKAGTESIVADRPDIGAWETFTRINLSKDELRAQNVGSPAEIRISRISTVSALTAGGSSANTAPLPIASDTSASTIAQPSSAQAGVGDATKLSVSASAAVGERDSAVLQAQVDAAQAKQAAVLTLAGVQSAQEQAAAAAQAQSAMARVMAAAKRSMCVHFGGAGCIEVPATRPVTTYQNNVVTVSQATTLMLGRQGSFECWIRRSELSPMILVSKGDDANVPEFAVRVGTGVAFCNLGRWLPESGSLQAGVWQHIAVTYDQSQVSYFIDGQLIARVSGETAVISGPGTLRIGQLGAGARGDNFKGEIDEVRLWSTARTVGELRGNRYRTVHGATPGLLSCWRLDEGGGTSALEQSDVGNHGTLRGDARFGYEGAPVTPAQLGEGLALDNDVHIELSDANLVPGIALTFEARVRIAAIDEDIVSVLNKWSSDEHDEFLFGIQRDGRLILTWQGEGGRYQEVSEATVPRDRYAHVAVTRGGSTISFFIDGKSAGQRTAASAQPFKSGPTTLRIGAQLRGPARWLRGSLSEVRIWSIERTPEELLAARDLPLSGRESGLAAYYRLDEGSGTTAFDQTSAGRHGQIVNGNPLMLGGATLYLVSPAGELLLYHHSSDGGFDVQGRRIGTGWGDFARILSARDGHFYAVSADGRLLYYHHDATGAFDVQGREIGQGWDQFSWVGVGRFGRLYGLRPDGDLLMYDHDAALSWTTQGRKLDGGWGDYRRVFTGGSGCLYAVTSVGELRYYRHDEAGGWIARGLSLGLGWDNYAALLSSGNGEIYAVKRSGDLCFHRHDQNLAWIEGSGWRIGTGWRIYDPYTPLPSLTAGLATIGTQTGAAAATVTAVTPPSLPGSPLILAATSGEPVADTFAISTLGVSPSGFATNTVRVDAKPDVVTWTQQLSLNWLALAPVLRAHLQCGSVHVGAGAAQSQTVRGYFPQPFAAPPRVILTARSGTGSETFVVSTNGVSNTGFSARLLRADAPRGWGQDVNIDVLAFDSLQDLAGIEAASGSTAVGAQLNPSLRVQTVAIPFAQPFTAPPVVLLTPRGEAYDDCFSATVTSVTAAGFRVNVVRMEGPPTWGQNLQIDWLAIVPPAPGVVRSLTANWIVPGR